MATFLLEDASTWAETSGWTLIVVVPLRGRKLGVLFAASGLAALLLRRRWGGNWPLRLSALDPWQRGLVVLETGCGGRAGHVW